MFKLRSSLVNQLMKLVQDPLQTLETSTTVANQEDLRNDDKSPLLVRRRSSSLTSTSCGKASSKRKQIQSMLMRLKKSNLESLLKAIQSKGADPGGCVMFPSMASCLGMSAHVLLCQLFRWPDLQSDYDLKRLHSFCSLNNEPCKMQDLSIQSKLYECCNPYHWSRVMTALDQAVLVPMTCGSNPTTSDSQREQPSSDEQAEPGEMVISYATNGSNSSRAKFTEEHRLSHPSTWCQLAYWEECNRVGRLYPVSASTIEVFSAALLPKANDGLCLASLFKQNKRPSESTTRTREKIGQGILLDHSRENGVWVYNRTENAIFVNSPTLEPLSSVTSEHRHDTGGLPFTVIKVLPGYSIQIFDYAKSNVYERLRHPSTLEAGPFDPYSIRISFVKGWGNNYSRQVVTNCPCWLEILLNWPPNR